MLAHCSWKGNRFAALHEQFMQIGRSTFLSFFCSQLASTIVLRKQVFRGTPFYV